MRRAVNQSKLEQFMKEVGRRATSPGIVYFTGGSTALLLKVRAQTVDIDIKMDPEPEGIFEAISELKDSLDVNVELAAPDQFLPPLPGWRERSAYIATVGSVEFRHYDFYAQALSKIERGYEQDLADVKALLGLGLVDPIELKRFGDCILPDLIRYPAVDRTGFEDKIRRFLGSESHDES